MRAGGAARLGADLRVYISAPPGRRRRPRRHRTRKRTVGPAWSVSGPEELLESERELRVDACSAMHLGTAGRETHKGTALSRLGAGPVRSQQEAGRSCATRNGSTRLQLLYKCVIERPRCPRLPRDPRRAGRRSISRRLAFAATEAPTSEHHTQYEKTETLRTLVQIQQCFYWFIFNKDNHNIFDLGQVWRKNSNMKRMLNFLKMPPI